MRLVELPSGSGSAWVDPDHITLVLDTDAVVVLEDETLPPDDRVVRVAVVALDTGQTCNVRGPASDVVERLSAVLDRTP